jgi:hypothetical protein
MALYALMIVALLARLPGIFQAAFWSDEYFSWVTATQPSFVQFFLRCTGVDVYPPLSYLPVWLIAKFTDASWALRLPSALAGLALVWATLRFLRRHLEERYAVALSFLIALMPLSVYLGWEAKAYNFFALMNLLMLDEALRIADDPKRGWKRLALYVALSMWSFFLSPYFILAMLCGLLWHERGRGPAFRVAWKGAWVGMLWALPLLPFFLKTLLLYSGSSAYNSALPLAPLFSFENFSAGFWMSPASQLTSLLVFAISASMLALTKKSGSLFRMLASMAFLPPLLFLAVSALGKPNYNDRAMLISGISWILLAGLGALCLDKPLRAIMLGLLIFSQAAALFDYQERPEARRVDYSQPWNLVSSQWQEGDVIMHAYFESGLPFKYYAAREVETKARPESRPNYVHQAGALSAFPPNAKAEGIRGLWRKLNAWLGAHGMGLYAGLDPIFVDGPSLDAAVKDARRIWYVVASDQAVRRQMMPIPNGFRGGQAVGRSFDFANETWMAGKFKYAANYGDDEVRTYLYERVKR